MLRCITKITFTQTPTTSFPARAKTLRYSFVNNFKIESSWKNLTDSGEITLPKNIYLKDESGKRISFGDPKANIGGFNGSPIFLRGDKVKIESGYGYFDKAGNEKSPMVTVFEGFISQVTSKKPFVLEVENNMYQLKRVMASGGNGGYFPASRTLESILKEMLRNAGLNFTVSATTETNIGAIHIQQETIAQFLGRLQKDFHLEAYFRGDELRVGMFPHRPQDVKQPAPIFKFQYYNYATIETVGAIIDDTLEYKRKDDINLSATACNTIEENTGKTTKDGQAKTKKTRLEVLVTLSYGSDTPKVFVKERGKDIPPNEGGERLTFFFPSATTTKQLADAAAQQLKKYYYNGFRGKFTTFGLPYVKHGDYIDILDPVLPERNGRYVVKSVEYTGGIEGNRQEIELEYLIYRLSAAGKPITLDGQPLVVDSNLQPK